MQFTMQARIEVTNYKQRAFTLVMLRTIVQLIEMCQARVFWPAVLWNIDVKNVQLASCQEQCDNCNAAA